jgi:hypothetical protein
MHRKVMMVKSSIVGLAAFAAMLQKCVHRNYFEELRHELGFELGTGLVAMHDDIDSPVQV